MRQTLKEMYNLEDDPEGEVPIPRIQGGVQSPQSGQNQAYINQLGQNLMNQTNVMTPEEQQRVSNKGQKIQSAIDPYVRDDFVRRISNIVSAASRLDLVTNSDPQIKQLVTSAIQQLEQAKQLIGQKS